MDKTHNEKTADALRELADWLDANPDLHCLNEYPISVLFHVDDKESLRDIAKALPGKVDKHFLGNSLYVAKYFGLGPDEPGYKAKVIYEAKIGRDAVCERIEDGVEVVEETEIVESHIKLKVVPKYRWECNDPILKP